MPASVMSTQSAMSTQSVMSTQRVLATYLEDLTLRDISCRTDGRAWG